MPFEVGRFAHRAQHSHVLREGSRLVLMLCSILRTIDTVGGASSDFDFSSLQTAQWPCPPPTTKRQTYQILRLNA